MIYIEDRAVTYEKLINDLSDKIAQKMKNNLPEHISQRKAYSIFGRANVERWKRQGKILPCKRPGKIEYSTTELTILKSQQQDYLIK